jgi:two-component system, LytTR family, sensor kinase
VPFTAPIDRSPRAMMHVSPPAAILPLMHQPERPRFQWRLVVAVWLLPTIADVADTYFARKMEGGSPATWRVLVTVAPGWLVWIAFTPAIFWLGARIPLRRPLRASAVVEHLALAVVFGMLHALVYPLCLWAFGISSSMTPWGQYTMSVTDWLPVSMLLYLMTLLAGYALEGAQRERAQRLRTTELEGQLARSELAVLRAQLHPHFLFNALNTAVSLVRANQPDAGVQVLTHLADLLRQLVHGVEQEVTLREEMRILDSYLEIERARFGSRLTIVVDVPAALQDAYVPGLVLQPLVENALRHGVGKRDAPGHVWIDASTSGDTLELRVRDDGPGISLEAPESEVPGVGLANTRARLARLYGPAGTLALRNAEGGGAEVVASMPVRFTPVHGAAA